MMCRILFILLLSISIGTAFGQYSQDELIEESGKLISNGQYIDAIKNLELVLTFDENNLGATYQLAQALHHSFQYERAEGNFRKVVYLAEDTYPEARYYLALMEKFNGKYKESIHDFEQFLNQPSNDNEILYEQARVELAGSSMALSYQGREKYSEVLLPAPINSDYNDYAAATYDSLLLITSSRVTRRNKKVDHRFGEAFAEQYLFETNAGRYSENDEAIKELINRFNDGSGCFTTDGSQYFFTICGYKTRECQIYQAIRLDDGSFGEPTALPEVINLPGYEAKQPGIISDTLYFVSNRPGGHGDNDIWFSITKNGNWSTPKNLGPSVNTPMNENSPKPTLSNLLFFASNGHQGFGGMDLFMARRKSAGDTSLVNLGFPFNSNRDDMFPEVSGNKFYWSSNKESSAGGFNIYACDINSPLHFSSMINIMNREAGRKSALTSPREVRELNGSFVTIVNKGELRFDQLPPEEQRAIDAIALGASVNDVQISNLAPGQIDAMVAERRKELAAWDNRVILKQIPASPGPGSWVLSGNISCIFCESEIPVELQDMERNPKQRTRASFDGKFRFSNLQGNQTVAIEVDSSLGGAVNIDEINLEFISDISEFSYTSIYFNLAESNIRPEASIILDSLASYLRKNPDMQLEIIAHADNTGSEAYNDYLTQLRAKAVFETLISREVLPTSMMVRAKGFREPSASNATPLGRQLNRRVEFKISGTSPVAQMNFKYCFTREVMNGVTLKSLLSAENLIELNEANESRVYRSYLPVVVPKKISPKTLECLLP